METKPFSLQSPEQIAKDYGGNKQKIAEAMQMGIVDPTAGTLAGMFIDRMRSAQMQEQAPQTTVAQQVMGGLPPTPQAAPPQLTGGLGATPQAMPPMAPQMPPQQEVIDVPMPSDEMPSDEMPSEEMPQMAGGGRVHGHFNASDRGSNYGANISFGDDTGFRLEGEGRNALDLGTLRAILSKKVGGGSAAVRRALRGSIYGGDFRQPRKTEYEYQRPFLGGQLGIHAGSYRGVVPDSVRASYTRQFAEGGIASLPIPDTMFDEPDNGGYATGGLVAFADGGAAKADPLAWLRAPISSFYGAKRSTGAHQGQDFAVSGGTPIGVPAPGKVIKAATDDINGNYVVVRHPDGTTSSYSHLADFAVGEGDEVGPGQVIGLSGNTGRVRGKNGGHHLHFGARDASGNRINPTDFFKSIAPQTASGKWNPQVREADTSTPTGRAISLEDSMSFGRRLLGDLPREELERAKQYAREELDPVNIEKQAKADMWEGLAAMGFRMATSTAGNILGAISEAAIATLPELKVSKKERKERRENAIRMLMAYEDVDRKTAIAGADVGIDLYKTGISADQAAKALAFQEKELASRENIAAQDRNASIMAASLRANNPDKFDIMLAAYRKSYPNFSDVAIFKQMRTDGVLGSQQSGMVLPGAEDAGAEDGSGGMSILGSRPA